MANGLLANSHESHTDLLWAGSGGFDTVHHDDTLTGLGTEAYPLGVNSAYLDSSPWISASKVIAPTETLQPGQYIQILSSIDVSGNKNHCIGVKGGGFTFPTTQEIASWIDMSGYVPTSSFETYSALVNGDITNLYNSAIYLSGNKLDITAFTNWSANIDLSGDYIPTSASGMFYPMTGNPSGFLTEHQDISNLATKDELLNTSSFLSASISSISSFVSGNDDKYYPLTGNPSGFLTEHQSLEDYYKKTETSSKEEISAALKDKLDNDFSGNFYPMTGNPSGFLTEHQDLTYISAQVDNKLDKSESGNYYPMTGNPSGFLTAHQDLSDYATTSIVNNISSYLSGEIDNKLDKSESANYYPMTGNPSGFLTAHQSLDDYYKKTETSSKEELSAMFALFSADDTYTLVGGYNIGISSDDVAKETTIYFNGEPLSSYYLKTETSSKEQLDDAIQYLSANAGGVYTGVSPIVVNNDQLKISADTYSVSAGSGLNFINDNANHRTTLKLQLSAGLNTQLVYDPQTNYIRIDGNGDEQVNNVVRQYSANGTWLTAHQSLTNYYTKSDTSSKQELSSQFNNVSTAIQYVSANAGHTYTGISPIVVDNTTNQISADSWDLSAGEGVELVNDYVNKRTRIDLGLSAGENISFVYDVETNKLRIDGTAEGKIYSGVAPIQVNNTTNQISVSANELSAGPNIDIFEQGGNIVISSNAGNTYCYVYPPGTGNLDLDTMTAYNKVTVFAPGDYGPDRMLYGTDDNLNHSYKVMPSGLWVEAIKNRKEGGQFSWSLINSGWIGYNHMWEGD